MRTVRIWTLVLGALAAVFLGGCSEKTEEANFTFVVIGDTRPGGGDRITQPAVHLKSIEEINLLAPELVVNVGDFILGYNSGEGFDLTFKQWDEFDRVVKELKMPLYLAPGNHDIWDERSQEVYEKRYGAPYYSFDKGGCHFVILCSDLAKPKEAGSIAGDQLVWLKNDLEQNAVPGRTFVFLHQPLWQQVHVSGAAKAAWMKDVHPLLVQHKVHTVFAGHVHAYEYDSIDGIGYIITGGGGADLSRPEITGGFHHYMTVTVTPKEASLAVIPVGSIKPQEVITAEFRRKLEGMSASADIKTLVVGKDSLDDIPVTFEMNNVLDQPLKVEVRWTIDKQTDWSISEKILSTTMEPGKSGSIKFALSCMTTAATPSPQYSIYFYIGDAEAMKVRDGSLPLAKSINLSPLPAGLTIDGKLDEWTGPEAGAMAHHSFIVTGVEVWKDAKDCSARFWLARDAEAIYLAVEVTDNAVYPNPNLAQLWGGDGVEVFFDFRGPDKIGQAKHSPGVVQFGFAPAKSGDDVAVWTAAPKIEGFVGKSTKTATGYTMELKFPVAGLKKAGLTPGPDFNFDIAVDDGDKSEPVSRKLQMVWSSSWDAWENASRYSRMLPAK